MIDNNQSGLSDPKISIVAMEFYLSKITSSQMFSGADRLQGFLRYVVEETMEGRAEKIRGKTIALDVYARSASSDGDPENVVRVDARRLRRRLRDYYEAEGQSDPIRIHIDNGGYAPRFEPISTSLPDIEIDVPAKRSRWLIVATAGISCAALFLSGVYLWRNSEAVSVTEISDLKKFERQTLLEKSPTALQAVNLAEQARGMVFPIFDVERQKIAHAMFDEAIRLDSDYFGGYAGAAQSLGSLAVLSQDPIQKEAYLEQASKKLTRAINLNPREAWTQISSAWVTFAKGDYNRALELSRRAYALDKNDWYVSDIHGLITFFTGNFTEAKNVSDPSSGKANPNPRSDNRNIYAAANFHLGAFQKTLSAFDEIAELGGPVGPPRLAYQVAAYHDLGNLERARTSASELMSTWPKARVDIVLLSFFENPTYANDVIDRLKASGWKVQE